MSVGSRIIEEMRETTQGMQRTGIIDASAIQAGASSVHVPHSTLKNDTILRKFAVKLTFCVAKRFPGLSATAGGSGSSQLT